MKRKERPSIKDSRGSLFEFGIGSWKQVNILTSKSKSIRGQHYHKKNKEKFVLLQGEILFTLRNTTTEEMQKIVLRQYESIIIEPFIWHQLDFIQDSTLLSFYSCEFEPENPDIFRL